METLRDEIVIEAPPEEVFEFFRTMDESRYLAWHPDHVSFEYVDGDSDGDGIAAGTVAYFEEYVGDDYHAMEVRYTDVVPGERIEFGTTHPLWRLFYPKSTFAFEPVDGGTRFVAENHFRVGPLASRSSHVRQSFADVERHVREEGENLKELLERDDVGAETVDGAGEKAVSEEREASIDRADPGTDSGATGDDGPTVRGG